VSIGTSSASKMAKVKPSAGTSSSSGAGGMIRNENVAQKGLEAGMR